MSKQFLLLHPWLYSELGHSFIYSKYLQKAAEINGWDFLALLPKKTLLQDLPSKWLKKIDCPTVRHWYEAVEKVPYKRERKVIRAKQRLKYYASLYRSIKAMMTLEPKKSFIFFMEAFGETDVRLLSYLLKFLPAKRITVGLIHRYQSKTLGNEVVKYREHHERIVHSGASLYLFTDSDLLKEDLEKSLYYPVDVLPIHYIEENLWSPLSQESPVKCWWPGIVRAGKGLEIMQQFAKSSEPSNPSIELIFSEDAKIERGKSGPLVLKLPAHLNREKYLFWLKKSQVILLPYTDPHYQKATSSIFIEAIMANRLPLVYPKTWMAYELAKYDLKELIIEQSAHALSTTILELVRNSKVHEKLAIMRQSYLNFHKLEPYAKKLKEVLSL